MGMKKQPTIFFILLSTAILYGCTALTQAPIVPPVPVPSSTPIPATLAFNVTSTMEVTSTPSNTHLDFGNIKSGQYLLALAYEQDQYFLYFISTEKQIEQRLSLNSYVDVDSVFGGDSLNADFATSRDGRRFLIMRPYPKKSYLLNLETAQWDTLDLQGKCSNASWPSDKTIIALECFDRGLSEIHFYNTLSNSFEIVTDCEVKENICGNPEWSLDGHWLAYIRSEARSGPQTINGIYLFDTSCVQRKDCMETQIGPIQSDGNPTWSMDNKLVYARSGIMDSYDPQSRASEKTSIHLPDSTRGIAVEFSPDGKYLALSASKTSGEIIYLYSQETNHFDVLLDDHSILWIIGWILIP